MLFFFVVVVVALDNEIQRDAICLKSEREMNIWSDLWVIDCDRYTCNWLQFLQINQKKKMLKYQWPVSFFSK